jgi:hypothetical protein
MSKKRSWGEMETVVLVLVVLGVLFLLAMLWLGGDASEEPTESQRRAARDALDRARLEVDATAHRAFVVRTLTNARIEARRRVGRWFAAAPAALEVYVSPHTLLLAALAGFLVWGARANVREARAVRGSVIPTPGWPVLGALLVIVLALADQGAAAALAFLGLVGIFMFRRMHW